MNYLTLEKATTIIEKYGNCDFDAELSGLLDCIDALIDEWLGYSPRLQEYCVKHQPNHKGTIFLYHAPVVEISQIEYYLPSISGTATQLQSTAVQAVFDGKQTLDVSGYCSCSNLRPTFKITYLAGEDPLPPIFAIAATKVLQEAIQHGIEHLSNPYKQLKKTVLPSVGGNLSQEYAVGTIAPGTTVIDTILTPLLDRYRQTIFFA